MTPIELLEAVKVASDGNRSMGSYHIPVVVYGRDASLDPPHVIDRMITEGWPNENTMFCLSYQNEESEEYEEDWFPLGEMEIAGKTDYGFQIFIRGGDKIDTN